MGFLDFFTGDQPPLIKGALEDVCAMLNTGRDMFAASSAHLFDNEILEVDLIGLDAAVNQREQALRQAVLEHLTIDPKRELVLCLKLVTVVHEAERIGDLSRMIGHAAELAEKPRLGPLVDELRNLRDRTNQLFNQSRDCFMDGDPVRAQSIQVQQKEVCNELRECVTRIADSDMETNEAVVCTLGAHAVSRVGSHLANIANCVIAPFHRVHAASPP